MRTKRPGKQLCGAYDCWQGSPCGCQAEPRDLDREVFATVKASR